MSTETSMSMSLLVFAILCHINVILFRIIKNINCDKLSKVKILSTSRDKAEIRKHDSHWKTQGGEKERKTEGNPKMR